MQKISGPTPKVSCIFEPLTSLSIVQKFSSIVVIISAVIIIHPGLEETKPIPSPITSSEKSPFTTLLPTIRTPLNRSIGLNNLSFTEKVEETVRRGFHVPFPENR